MVGAAAFSMSVHSHIAAVALALFMAFVSLALVQFWSVELPADAWVMVRSLFIGNVAIVGGCSTSPSPASWRHSTSHDPDRLPEIRQEVYPEQSGSNRQQSRERRRNDRALGSVEHRQRSCPFVDY
jgi:hypothetical protein